MSYHDAGLNPAHKSLTKASVNENFNAIPAAIAAIAKARIEAEARIKEKARIKAEARIEKKKNAVLAVCEDDGPPPNKRKC